MIFDKRWKLFQSIALNLYVKAEYTKQVTAREKDDTIKTSATIFTKYLL